MYTCIYIYVCVCVYIANKNPPPEIVPTTTETPIQKPYTAARNGTLPQLGSYMHKKGPLLCVVWGCVNSIPLLGVYWSLV